MGIGAAIYYFVVSSKDKVDYQCEQPQKKEPSNCENTNNNSVDEENKEIIVNFTATKQDASSNIKSRHEEAAQIMRESIEQIYNNESNESEFEESEADEINAQLDNLLN